MSRTIKDNPYGQIRKPVPRPGHAFGFSKYSKQDRQEEKKEIEKQLEELEDEKIIIFNNKERLCDTDF